MNVKVRIINYIMFFTLFFLASKSVLARSGSFTYETANANYKVACTINNDKVTCKASSPSIANISLTNVPTLDSFLKDGKLDCENPEIATAYIYDNGSDPTKGAYRFGFSFHSSGKENEYTMSLATDTCKVNNESSSDNNEEQETPKTEINTCEYGGNYTVHVFDKGGMLSIRAENLKDSSTSVVIATALSGKFKTECPPIYVTPSYRGNIKYENISLNDSGKATKYTSSSSNASSGNNNSSNGSTNSEKVYEIEEGCEGILGHKDDPKSVAYWLQWILNLIKYIAIVALLGLSTIDFVKALVADDKDALKKASITTAKRFIYVVLIFFLPIIVEVLMELFDVYSTCDLR